MAAASSAGATRRAARPALLANVAPAAGAAPAAFDHHEEPHANASEREQLLGLLSSSGLLAGLLAQYAEAQRLRLLTDGLEDAKNVVQGGTRPSGDGGAQFIRPAMRQPDVSGG